MPRPQALLAEVGHMCPTSANSAWFPGRKRSADTQHSTENTIKDVYCRGSLSHRHRTARHQLFGAALRCQRGARFLQPVRRPAVVLVPSNAARSPDGHISPSPPTPVTEVILPAAVIEPLIDLVPAELDRHNNRHNDRYGPPQPAMHQAAPLTSQQVTAGAARAARWGQLGRRRHSGPTIKAQRPQTSIRSAPGC